MAQPDHAVGLRRDRPTVTVKVAQTLDGRIATCTGQSQWISGPESLTFAHELRAAHDAILVGIGTVLHDNPRLTVRLVAGASPRRVVADTQARTPLDCNLLSQSPELTTVAVSERAPADRVAAIQDRGAQVVRCPVGDDGRVDLAALLVRLAGAGVGSLMVEGGAGIVTSLLRARIVDRLIVCIAPKLIGAGIDAIGDLGIRHLDDAVTFQTTTVRQLGQDIIFDGVLIDAAAGEPDSAPRDARGRPPSSVGTMDQASSTLRAP